ncbi:hypothetical protein PC116_g23060 [Phytophthora cactorum]|nr:hypothetical protein PC116_g23060 [Phytophthora cactorum]
MALTISRSICISGDTSFELALEGAILSDVNASSSSTGVWRF